MTFVPVGNDVNIYNTSRNIFFRKYSILRIKMENLWKLKVPLLLLIQLLTEKLIVLFVKEAVNF